MGKIKEACAVCDAGPIIHLDELGCLNLLEDFKRLLVPTSVWKEVIKYRGDAFSLRCELSTASPVPAAWEEIFRSLALHRGEMDALRLAARLPARLLLTDDMAARLAAEKLGVPAVGTLGILVRSIRRRFRTKAEVIDILRQLPSRSTLHLKPSLLAKVIARVETDE